MTDVPEMIERVARALVSSEGDDPDALIHTMKGKTPVWTLGVEQARAALAAIREPTEPMLQASEREWDGRMSARSAGVWQAMIDAALNPTPQTTNPARREPDGV